jgi:DNA-binding response OmpR family regulator
VIFTGDPKLKVLFFSALDSTQEIMSVLPNMKLNDVIRKPIEANELLKTIKNALC